eukprot:m.7236 g.7236  ORF g.7236 m.7236 type:complete len:576 (+) comp5228_c0_seq2:644-2371(+)
MALEKRSVSGCATKTATATHVLGQPWVAAAPLSHMSSANSRSHSSSYQLQRHRLEALHLQPIPRQRQQPRLPRERPHHTTNQVLEQEQQPPYPLTQDEEEAEDDEDEAVFQQQEQERQHQVVGPRQRQRTVSSSDSTSPTPTSTTAHQVPHTPMPKHTAVLIDKVDGAVPHAKHCGLPRSKSTSSFVCSTPVRVSSTKPTRVVSASSTPPTARRQRPASAGKPTQQRTHTRVRARSNTPARVAEHRQHCHQLHHQHRHQHQHRRSHRRTTSASSISSSTITPSVANAMTSVPFSSSSSSSSRHGRARTVSESVGEVTDKGAALANDRGALATLATHAPAPLTQYADEPASAAVQPAASFRAASAQAPVVPAAPQPAPQPAFATAAFPPRKAMPGVPTDAQCTLTNADGTKIHVTYASIIALALYTTPSGKLKLDELYTFISRFLPYIQSPRKSAWKNSVRHNLSVKHCFIKPQHEAKSPYWMLDLTQQTPLGVRTLLGIYRQCVRAYPDFTESDFRAVLDLLYLQHNEMVTMQDIQAVVSQTTAGSCTIMYHSPPFLLVPTTSFVLLKGLVPLGV